MGGESSAQKRARKTSQSAITTSQRAETEYANSPLYQELFQRALGLAQDPYSLGPDDIAKINQNAASRAQMGSRNFLDQEFSRLAGSGSGMRSGARNAVMGRAATGLGTELAQGSRQAEIQGALQSNADLVNAFNLIQSLLGQRAGMSQSLANTQLGVGNTLTGLAGQPSPLAQALGGVGQLGGSLLGAAGMAGVFGSLFGGAGAGGAMPGAGFTGQVNTMAGLLCWVAEAIFGKDAWETHAARYWVRFKAPAWFRWTYLAIGRPVAWLVRRSAFLRRTLRPFFVRLAHAGQEAMYGV